MAQFGDMLKKAKEVVTSAETPMENETTRGLKEALNMGIENAVAELSVKNGFLDSPYKVLIPSDAKKIISKVKHLPGFENVETELVNKMNKAAELAVRKSTPIFIEAIKNMNIKDATKILFGNSNAATSYLENSTRSSLYTAFMPAIQSSLDEVNARTYWTSIVSAYNKLPFVKKVNPQLDDHVNSKSLDGLFSLIENKESAIRKNQDQRSTELLRKVFAKQD